VELKGSTQAWHSQVAEILAARRLTDRAVVQGFDAVALRWLKHRQPELRVAPLFWRRPGRARLRAVATFATAIGVRHVAVDPALLRHARACGLAVRAWTANAPSDIERLLDMGVDGVISDVPDVARALVDTRMPLALSA
jgi:glycerophosphoryl diester phosphodiesterase